jgi:hypothetical protein
VPREFDEAAGWTVNFEVEAVLAARYSGMGERVLHHREILLSDTACECDALEAAETLVHEVAHAEMQSSAELSAYMTESVWLAEMLNAPGPVITEGDLSPGALCLVHWWPYFGQWSHNSAADLLAYINTGRMYQRRVQQQQVLLKDDRESIPRGPGIPGTDVQEWAVPKDWWLVIGGCPPPEFPRNLPRTVAKRHTSR